MKRTLFTIAVFFVCFLAVFSSRAEAISFGEPFPYHFESAVYNSDRFLQSLTFDKDGNSYRTYVINSIFSPQGATIDLNPDAGQDLYTLQGNHNLFLTKFDSDGHYVWGKYVGYVAVLNDAFSLSEVKVTREHIFIDSIIRGTSASLYNPDGSTQAVSNPVSTGDPFFTTFVARYNLDGELQNVGTFPGGTLIRIETDYDRDELYVAGGFERANLDFEAFNSDTYNLSSTGNEANAYFAKYNSSLDLQYAYYWPADDQGNFIYSIDLAGNNVFLAYGYNNNIVSPVNHDMNPTSGVDMQLVHQHDPTILSFNKDGTYRWHSTVTSSGLVGLYSFIDDEFYSDMVVSDDEQTYVIMRADSDAVRIGTQLYVKRVQGQNNVTEGFLYKLDSSGNVLWSRYFQSPASNVSNTNTRVYYDNRLDKVIVLGTVNSQSIVINGTTYTAPPSPTTARDFFTVFDHTGALDSVHFFDFLGGGTLSTEAWFGGGAEVANFADKTTFTLHYSANASNLSVDLDPSPTGSSLQSLSTLQRYFLTFSLDGQKQSAGPQQASNEQGCQLMSPGLKVPWLYAVNPLSSTALQLYFAPGDEPFDRYTFKYGTKSDEYPYGAADVTDKNMRIFTINNLSPNTEYFFRIRSGNGCATGEWSNELSGKTSRVKKITTQ